MELKAFYYVEDASGNFDVNPVHGVERRLTESCGGWGDQRIRFMELKVTSHREARQKPEDARIRFMELKDFSLQAPYFSRARGGIRFMELKDLK